MLALFALARGREVIVSRGELVEIGGSFRIPEILEAAGAQPARGGHHQPHPARRLPAGDRPRDRAAAQGLPQQLPDRRLHRRSLGRRAGGARPGTRRAAPGRRRQRPSPAAAAAGHPPSQHAPSCWRPAATWSAPRATSCSAARRRASSPAAPTSSRRAGGARSTAPCGPTASPTRRPRRSCGGTARRGQLPLERLWPEPTAHAGAGGRGWPPGWAPRWRPRSATWAPAARRTKAFPRRPWRCRRTKPCCTSFARAASGSRRELPPVVGYLRGDRLWLDLRTVDPLDDELLVRSVLAAQRPGRGRFPGPRMSARILVVEDRDALRRLMQRALEQEGYEVSAAQDVQQGKNAAGKASDEKLRPGDHRPDAAGRQRARRAGRLPREEPGGAGGGADRLRLGAERGAGDAAGRRRLPREAARPRPALLPGAPLHRRGRSPGGSTCRAGRRSSATIRACGPPCACSRRWRRPTARCS